MRDIALFAVFFSLAPAVIWRPFVGALLWVWLAIMNPQTLAGGAAKTFPFALAVGTITLISWLFSRDPKRPPANPVVALLLLYIAWGTLTTFFALYHDGAVLLWNRFIRIQLSNLLLLLMLTSRPRIDALIWTICVSLGYFITRGGLFTLATGGRYLTYGPGGTEIAGNNEFGVALLMAAPLLFYLGRTAPFLWLRIGSLGELALTIVTVIGTYSRGAFSGLAILGGLMLLQARQRMRYLVLAAVLAVVVVQFFPGYWLRRVESIQGFHSDTSLTGRINAWRHGVNVALAHPFVGGGMGAFSLPVYEKYSPGLPNRAAHSIYFQTLGEQGFVGLAIFLAVLAAGLFNCLTALRRAKHRPELAWADLLARSLAFSIVGYATAGAFVTLANLDLYYMILSLTVALRRCVDAALAGEGREATVAATAPPEADAGPAPDPPSPRAAPLC